jgi:hypothetical protein
MAQEGNRTPAGRNGDEAREPRKQPEGGRDWFEDACTNTEAHGILAEIDAILKAGDISASAGDIIKKAQEFANLARWPICPSFCALLIHVMKPLARRPDADKLCDCIFGILADAWSAGLRAEDQRDLLLQHQGQHIYKRILNPQRLLEGWAADLSDVAQPCLPSYLRLLHFERLHTRNQQLDTALAAFVKRINDLSAVKPVAPQDVNVAAKATAVFESEILESLPKDQAISHVAKATQLIAIAVQADASVLKSDTGHVRRAMNALPGLILRANVSRRAAGRDGPTQEHLHKAYLVLNELHRRNRGARRDLRGPLAELIPCLEGYEPRPLRKNGMGWKASIEYTYNGQPHHLDGDVVDFCARHKGVHVKLGSDVKDCSSFPGKPISLKFHSREETHFVDRAKIILTHPAGDRRWECEAKAIRGWIYEEDFSKPSQDAGAAFSIADMGHDLGVCLDQLEDRSGLEPLAGYPSGGSDSAVAESLIPGSTIPFEDGPEGILKGLGEFLEGMANEIHLGRGWEAFWYKKGKPLKERTIDAQIRPRLETYVRMRGAALVPQAQSGFGPCDYRVEWKLDRVWIELKPSEGAWRQGMKKELAQHLQYDLATKRRCAGLFVVLAFDGRFHTNSKELTELLTIRDSVCGENGCRTDVAIIDCDMPLSASKGDVVEKPGSGLQYYPLNLEDGVNP